MKPAHTLLALVVALACLPAGARARDVQIIFAPPPMEGRISLGIFDAEGRLVRTLHAGDPFETFDRALNGLATAWDGRTDAGEFAPAGRYRARGVLVRNLSAEFAGLRGNDWPCDSPHERVVEILDAAFLPDETPVFLARRADGSRALVREDHTEPVDPDTQWIAASPGGELFLASAHRVHVARAPGREASTGVPITAIATNGHSLFVAEGAQVRTFSVADLSPSDPVPDFPGGEISALSATREVLAAAAGGRVWLLRDGNWSPLEKEWIERASDVACGGETSVWATDLGEEFPGLKQISLEGDFLRHLDPLPGDPLPTRVLAAPTDATLLLLESRPGLARARVLVLNTVTEKEGEKVSHWRTQMAREIADTRQDHPGDPLRVSLRGNPLTAGEVASLDVRVEVRSGQVVLLTGDGLSLLHIGPAAAGAEAGLLEGDTRERAWLEIRDPAGTQLFAVRNLRDMLPFDAGTFLWDGAQESLFR